MTALVIVAWRFGSPEDEPVHGLKTSTTAAASGGAGCRRRPGRRGSSSARRAANSYLLVKKSSALGKILYQGTLERGQKQRFDGQVLWVRLESPQNVLSAATATAFGCRPPSRRRASS